MSNFVFQTIDWNNIEQTEQKADSGMASWKTVQLEGLRLRIVEYSAGYFANHWCSKGHVVYCIEGEFTSEMQDGRKFILKKGMNYVVSDEMGSHRSITENGVKLLIIDGDFLKPGK